MYLPPIDEVVMNWTHYIYHPHTKFHYTKLLTCLSHDYGSIINVSSVGFGGIGYRQVVT